MAVAIVSEDLGPSCRMLHTDRSPLYEHILELLTASPDLRRRSRHSFPRSGGDL